MADVADALADVTTVFASKFTAERQVQRKRWG